MKTKLLALALVGLFTINSTFAQEQGDMRASIGLVMGTVAAIDEDNGELKMGFGITPAFEYVFVDAMSANLSYDLYFGSDIAGETYKLSSLNIDYRYYFMTDDIEVYGLAGLGFMKVDLGSFGSESKTGLNIGAGANFPLADALAINAQLKYTTVKVADVSGDEKANLGINVGLVYKFGN